MPTVLLIEDNDKLARGLQSNLEFEGYDVVCASDGAAGLALARERRPDIIVLDLMLPDTDGYRVLRTLRDDGATTFSSYIFVTQITDLGVSNLSTAIVTGAVRDTSDGPRICEQHVVLDTSPSVVLRTLR